MPVARFSGHTRICFAVSDMPNWRLMNHRPIVSHTAGDLEPRVSGRRCTAGTTATLTSTASYTSVGYDSPTFTLI